MVEIARRAHGPFACRTTDVVAVWAVGEALERPVVEGALGLVDGVKYLMTVHDLP